MSLEVRARALAARLRTEFNTFRLSELVGGVNVKKFGAVGDGVADDTLAIQAAIDSLPTAGGAVYLPTGTYVITDAIELRSALKVFGDGPSATVIWQQTGVENGLQGTDILFCEIAGLRLSGPSTGTGRGISLARTLSNNTNNVVLTNVFVRTFGGDGIWMSNGIASTLTNVQAAENGGYGIHLIGEGGVAGTSVGLHSCFTDDNALGGYLVETMAYCSFAACASDNQPIGYDVQDCLGVVFQGCGAEGIFDKSWNIDGGYGVTIAGGWIYANDGIGVHIHGASVGNTVIGLSDTSPGVNATYFIEVAADGSKASLINVHNDSPMSLPSGSVNQISDAATDAWLASNLQVPGEVKIGPDTNLYRVAADQLATDDLFVAGGGVYTWGNFEAFGGFGVNDTPPVVGKRNLSQTAVDSQLEEIVTLLQDLGFVGTAPAVDPPPGEDWLPSYAGARAKPFLPGRSAYNWTETSTRRLRAALAKHETSRVLLNVIGHSGAAGGGDVTLGKEDVANRIRRYLLSIGAASGTGLVVADQNVGGPIDTRIAKVGTWSGSANDSDPYYYTLAANAELIFTADAPGTVAEFYVANNTGPVEIYVNGELKETYTGPNVGIAATAWVAKSYTGLAFYRHVIRIKSTNTQGVAVHGFRVRNATGLEVSNLGRGGAEVADWNDVDYNSVWSTMNTAAPPNVVIISAGANEALGVAGGSPTAPLAAMVADYTTLLTALQAAGVACIMLIEGPPPTSGAGGFYVTEANWNLWLDAYYDLADSFDVPLVDSTHAMGSAAIASSLGMISGDNLHLNRAGYGLQAELILGSLLESLTLSPATDVADLEYAPAIGRPLNSQVGTTYTTAAADIRQWIASSHATGQALTVAPQSSMPCPLGTELMGSNEGVGDITLTAGSGVTLNSKNGLKVKTGGVWSAKKTAMPNTWRVFGDLAVS